MTLHLAPAVAAAIDAHARRVYPDECCGALLGALASDAADRHVTGSIALENEAGEARSRRFLVSPARHRACERLTDRLGLDVLGFYHSHPDAEPVPSSVDRAFGWPWYCCVITAVSAGGAGPRRAWMLRDDRAGFRELDLSIVEAAP